MRVDKFLWSVRVFKTRSMATAASREGKVFVGGVLIKASREVKLGEQVSVRRNGITREWEIMDLPRSRVGASLVDNYIKEVTSQEELSRMEAMRMESRNAPKMKGRPTKRNRRDWNKWVR